MTKRANSDQIDPGHKGRKKVKMTSFIERLKIKFLDIDLGDDGHELEVYEDEWEDWLDIVQPFPDELYGETNSHCYDSEDEFDIKRNDLDSSIANVVHQRSHGDSIDDEDDSESDDVIYVGTSKTEENFGVQSSIANVVHQRSQEFLFEGEADRYGVEGDGPGFDDNSEDGRTATILDAKDEGGGSRGDSIDDHDEDDSESDDVIYLGTVKIEKDDSSESYMEKVEFTTHDELKRSGYILDDIVGRTFKLRPHERINFSEVGDGWRKELAEMEDELSFCRGNDPIRFEIDPDSPIIWNSGGGTAKCIGFRCVYSRCSNKSEIFLSRSEYNKHCVKFHSRDHKKQKGPLKFTVNYADGDFDRMEQCGSCAKFFPLGSIRHYQKECLGKRQVFETETYAMFMEFKLKKFEGDKRFKTPKEFFCTMFGRRGYYMFLRIVRDGVYDLNVKNAFVVNENVYECKSKNARFYIVGSKALGVCYIGSCLTKILSRFKRHISGMSKGGTVLSAEDCICSSLGHLFGANAEFKKTKETFEFAIANNLEKSCQFQFPKNQFYVRMKYCFLFHCASNSKNSPLHWTLCCVN